MALGTITPSSSGGMRGVGGETPSPDFSKIPALKGNFGPIPAMVTADLTLAQDEFLQEYLQSVDPGHSFHLVNIWLYDHPSLLTELSLRQ
jgi:hypothetical protein